MTTTDAELLTFEAAHPRDTPAKEELIRNQLGITPARYYQRLQRHIWTETALAADPRLVDRLRTQAARIRQTRPDRHTTP